MTATVGSIRVLFEVNHVHYERGINRAASATESAGTRMTRSIQRTDRATSALARTTASLRGREFRVLSLAALRANDSVERLRGSVVALASLFGGFGAAFTLKGIADYSDTYKEVGNRLRIVKSEAESLAAVEQRIFETAQKSRAQYAATGTLYARIANSARQLQISSADVLRVTETIQKAFIVGGSTPVEAAQSSIQLSQGIASNRLQGDELRSVLENPALGQLLADQITGGDLGKLRKLAAEGELTAGVIVRAFKEASGEIDRLFATTEQTIGQAFARVDNAILRYIGTSENAKGATSATVVVLNALADNMETVGDSAMYLGGALLALLGARGVGGVSRAMATAITQSQAYAQGLRSTAAANAALARQEFLTARQHRISAQAFYEMTKSSTVSARTRSRAGRELQAAYIAESMAAKSATAANLAHATALRTTTVSARVASVAVRGLNASLAFVGGPIGAALLALGGFMYLFSTNAAEAAERTEAFKQAGDDATRMMEQFTGQFTRFAEGMAAVATMQAGIEGFNAQLNDLAVSMAKMVDLPAAISIRQLITELQIGRISSEEFTSRLDDIARANPGIASLADTAQGLAKKLDDARAKSVEMSEALDDLEGRDIEIEVKVKMGIDQIRAANEALREQAIDFLKDRIENNKSVDPVAMRMFGEELKDVKPKRTPKPKLSDADRRERAGEREALRDLERYIDGMERLRNSGAEMFMSEMDQKVIDTARSFGIAEEQVRAFMEASRNGGDIPVQIQAIATELDKIAANQRIVDLADGIASGFGDAITSLATGSKSASEAFKDLAMSVYDLALQLFVVEPLMRSIRASMLGGFGGSVDPWAGMRVPVAHGGWTVGSGPAPGSRTVHPGVFAGAPHFKTGLGNDEFAAILHRSERVLTDAQTESAMNVIGAVASGASRGGNQIVNIQPPAGYEAETTQGQGAGGEDVMNVMFKKIEGRYGLKPATRRI